MNRGQIDISSRFFFAIIMARVNKKRVKGEGNEYEK
jgi:hypothetical protein